MFTFAIALYFPSSHVSKPYRLINAFLYFSYYDDDLYMH